MRRGRGDDEHDDRDGAELLDRATDVDRTDDHDGADDYFLQLDDDIDVSATAG
ncbi:hypothetical protein HJD18_10690 [Thermoleophilia bacterium SCSIO 60948]|nr:hypothetical protein HJD18_10690 [Thermoleophilia bacterium SCSIO 60948]